MRNVVCKKTYLRAVGVGASVGHGEKAGAVVLQDEVLVIETSTIDRFSTTTIASSEVTTLH